MKVRLKQDCEYGAMHTPYGTVTKDWTEVPDGSYVYKEMEVEGAKEEKTVEVEEPKVEKSKSTSRKSVKKKKSRFLL